MNELTKLNDFDNFFFYGQNEIESEIQSDILWGLIQPKRSMYYNRQESAGVNEKQNFPNALNLQIQLRYDIVNWATYRNNTVSDGTNNTRDRRAAMSWNSIFFNNDKKGNLDIKVLYIPFSNFKKPDQISIPISRGF